MSKKPEINIHFHPFYEVVLSLTCFIKSTFYKKSDLGTAWLREVKKQLRPELLEELQSKSFHTAHDFYYPLTYYQTWNHSLSIEECIEQYGSLSREEITAFIKSLGINEYNVSLCGIKDFNEYIDNILASQRQMAVVVTQWYEDYFSGVDHRLIKALNDEAKTQLLAVEKQLSDGVSTEEIIEQVTGGLFVEGLEDIETVLLTPQYHAKPINVYDRSPKIFKIAFPVDIKLDRDTDTPSPELGRMLQALSDNTRLRILKFLQDEPKSFTDIVQYIGLAKSTVHHHTVILRASGLIRVKIGAKKGETFELRHNAIDLLPQLLHGYFKDK